MIWLILKRKKRKRGNSGNHTCAWKWWREFSQQLVSPSKYHLAISHYGKFPQSQFDWEENPWFLELVCRNSSHRVTASVTNVFSSWAIFFSHPPNAKQTQLFSCFRTNRVNYFSSLESSDAVFKFAFNWRWKIRHAPSAVRQRAAF